MRRGLSRVLVLTSTLTAAAALLAAVPASAGAAPVAARPGALPPVAMLPGSLTGVVRGANGSGLAGACVTARGFGHTATGFTSASGRYLMSGMRPGRYAVSFADCARAAAYFSQGGMRVTVQAARPTALAPVTLRSASPAAMVSPRGRVADGGGVISGVVRSRSGRALAGICVDASTSSGHASTGIGTTTSANGHYSLSAGRGHWLVAFSGCGRGNRAPQWWRYAASPRRATLLRITRGQSFHGIDARLSPGAGISGTVRSAQSHGPLKGICVVASGLGSVSAIQVEARTGANGSYLIPDLGTGRYQVRFVGYCGHGNYLGASHARAVRVTDGKTTTGINAYLQQAARISGLVTSRASGKPLSGICVTLVEHGDSGNADFTATGPSGRFSFGHLTPGRYSVAFAGCANSGSYAPQFFDGQANALAASWITLRPGTDNARVNAAMLPGGTIRGRVANPAGAGLRNACVAAVSQNLAGGVGDTLSLSLLQDLETAGDLGVGEAQTGPAGGYTIRNLPPGLYALEFDGNCNGQSRYGTTVFAPQGGGRAAWVSAVGGTVTTNVNGFLPLAGSISGVVTGPHGPESGACVLAYNRGPAFPIGAAGATSTNRHGAYRIGGLAPGRYAVAFLSCQSAHLAVQWYRRAATEASAVSVRVRAQHTTTGIDGRVAGGGTVTGAVVSATGRPVDGACVVVSDGLDLSPYELGAVLGNGTITNRAGQYRLTGVTPGRWKVIVAQCQSARPLLGAVVRTLRVRNRATAKVNFRLARAGQISGLVLGGSPAAAEPGICVEVTSVSGDGAPGTAVTAADGRYTLPGLAPGRYRVEFTPLCLIGTAAVAPQADATTVKVTAGGTITGVGTTLAADGGISGTVRHGGQPVAGVCVGAYRGQAGAPAAVVATGANGDYELGDLGPAGYTVEFSTGCGARGYPTQWYKNATSRAAATTVNVPAGTIASGIDEG
jgi:hypothetical protein